MPATLEVQQTALNLALLRRKRERREVAARLARLSRA